MVPLRVCRIDRSATSKKEVVVSDVQEKARQRIGAMAFFLSCGTDGKGSFRGLCRGYTQDEDV